MKYIVQGCMIETDRSYIMIKYSKSVSIEVSYLDDCLYIKVPNGYKWSDLVDKRLSVIYDQKIKSTDYIKLGNPTYNLNGLEFRKTTPFEHVFSQFLLKDIEEFTMLFDENQTQVFIPLKLDFDIIKYIELLKCNPYLEVLNNKVESLKNFYAINLKDLPIKLHSDNDYSFNSKKFYTRYLLSPIDIHESFISKLRTLLDTYSLTLLKLPIQENTKTIDYVTYRYTDLNKQESHKTGYYPLQREVKCTAHIDFELSTPNMVILDDFKNRYQNLDFLTDFTTFLTEDKLGRSWSSECRWGPITTDFSQDYEQDQQGNQAFRLGFSCDLYYYVVYDDQYYVIQNIILEILNSKNNFNLITI